MRCKCKPGCEAEVTVKGNKYAQNHDPASRRSYKKRGKAISRGMKKFYATGIKAGGYVKKGFWFNGIEYKTRSEWQSARMKDPKILARATAHGVKMMRAKMQDPEHVKELTRKSHTPEASAKHSATLVRLWQDPEYRANQIEKSTIAHQRPAYKRKMSRIQRRRFKDPKEHKKLSVAQTKSWAENHDARAADISPKISATIRASYASGEREIQKKYHKGWYTSRKMRKRFPYRSQLEKLFMIGLDKDPHVVEWLYEALEIPYQFAGVTRTHVPDFFFRTRDGKWHVVEVKHSNYLADAQIVAKRVGAEAMLWPRDISYEIITEKEIQVAEA